MNGSGGRGWLPVVGLLVAAPLSWSLFQDRLQYVFLIAIRFFLFFYRLELWSTSLCQWHSFHLESRVPFVAIRSQIHFMTRLHLQ